MRKLPFRIKREYLIAGGILVACIAVAMILIVLRPSPPERPAEAQAPLVQVVPAEVRSGTIWVEGAGTVEAREEVALAPQVSGTVVYVHPGLVDGGYVRAGEVLVRIDPADYRHALIQAQADVAQQQVSVLEAEAEALLARAEYQRFRQREQQRRRGSEAQAPAQIVPPEALDDAGGAAAPGTLQHLALKEPQLRAARAALERARALRSDAELALRRTVLRAPFSGLVRSESVAIGAYVSPGQPIAEIMAADVLEVVVPLTSADAALIPNLWGGARVEARVYATYGPQRYRWDGYVHRVQAALDPATRTLNVVLRVPAPRTGGHLYRDLSHDAAPGTGIVAAQPPPLLAGTYVQVEIAGPEMAQYLVVPRSALREGNDLWVVQAGRLRRVPTLVIQHADHLSYLQTGEVAAGDLVVIGTLPVATEGMQVRPVGVPDTAAYAGAASTSR